ncbi:M23 family metallopeptidase [Ampullimonas aquatilis]|uniref:M23 family metallopeptidase n=1 Tax=Ampullimonas aquatilis TaxID=1341549 RepID=UPI003C74B215
MPLILMLGLLICCFNPVLHAEGPPPVQLRQVQEGAHQKVLAVNRGRMPVLLTAELKTEDNLNSDVSWPIQRVLPAASQQEIASFSAVDQRRPYRFTYQYGWTPGDPHSVPDGLAFYRLPFENGKTFRVSQAPGGPLPTHKDAESANAIDIPMPVGSKVLAARDGVVVDVEQGFGEGLLERSYINEANYVQILHDDGTWALYAHLLRGSVAVQPGMRVVAGTVIASSGNSGYSSEPHLHFAVLRNLNGQVVSITPHFWTRLYKDFTVQHQSLVNADYGRPEVRTAALR